MSGKKGVDFLKQVFEKIILQSKGHDNLLKKLQITGGGNGKCIAEFTVSEEHLNHVGGLHGGFTATIVDNITTFALMTKDRNPGVTVALNVNYLKGARAGDEVIVDATTIKDGKTLSYIECELRHKKNGSVIATGGQTKYMLA